MAGGTWTTCERCGASFRVKPSRLERTRYCSKGCREAAQSDAMVGSGNPQWAGGSSYEERERTVWRNQEGRRWIRACHERDGYKCQRCGAQYNAARCKGLEVHHCLGFREFPALRSVVENGISLCSRCHAYVHRAEGEAMRRRFASDAERAIRALPPGSLALPAFGDGKTVDAFLRELTGGDVSGPTSEG